VKNFIKLFFTVLLFFVSFSASGILSAESMESGLLNVSPQQTEIKDVPAHNEKYIVSANNNFARIFTTQKRNVDTGTTIDMAAVQNKLAAIFFNSKYNKINIRKFNTLSALLSNEVCTRAP